MRLQLFVAAAALLSANLAAHADTFTLGSYGLGVTSPTGVANSGMLFDKILPTFDISTNNVWAGPLSNSSWISFSPGTYPNGPVVAPKGTYTYTTEFTDTLASTGQITVLADDTTDILFNGHLIASDGSGEAAHCTVSEPNCTSEATYTLPGSDFVDGVNMLSFGVEQLYGNGTGLDFDGTVTQTSIAPTPEPSSFVLLGTGLLGIGGVARRRLFA